MSHFSLTSIAHHLQLHLKDERLIKNFSIDSRNIEKGTLFFALSGAKTDGHHFLEEVALKGAIAAIVSENYSGPNFGLTLLRVKDTRIALQDLGRIAAAERSEKIIQITGSYAKTTTKEFAATLLSSTFRVGKSEGSFNSQVTFPLTLLNLPNAYDLLVLEVGMSRPGEITQLVNILAPDIALITAIGDAHAEFFPGGLIDIAKAKGEIFLHARTRLGILGPHASKYRLLHELGTFPKWCYGFDDNADLQLYQLDNGNYQLSFQNSLSPEFDLPFKAKHLIEDFLGAAALCLACQMDWPALLQNRNALQAPALRFQSIDFQGIKFIQDCYNASPQTVIAALENLPSLQSEGKKIAVLGSMKELGRLSETSHRNVAEHALRMGIDELICLGEECRPMIEIFAEANRPAILCNCVKEIQEHLFARVKAGDMVLVKGSKSHQLWKVLEERMTACSSF